jgi:CheY-like chemotaxis protein
MGGSLTVRSEPGVGSTFTIVIGTGPIDSDIGILDIRQFGEHSGKAEIETSSAKKFRFDASRILLVDDGEANRQLVQLVLQRNGLLVETAVNGQEAVDKAAISDYDVILMDMQMPVMDGYAATSLLRERGLETPIVALTANAMRGDEEKCLDAGCNDFLSKPIEIDKLVELLADLLDAPERSDEELGALLETPATPAVMSTPEPARDEHHSEEFNVPAVKDVAINSSLDSVLGTIEPATESSRRLVEGSPVVSTLPMDDLEFRAIVVGFVDRLNEQIEAIDAAWQNRDLDELASLAHWLRGAVGTVGFHEFTEPGHALMQSAGADRVD